MLQKSAYVGDIAKVKHWMSTLQAKQEQLVEQIASFKDEAEKLCKHMPSVSIL